MNIRKRKKIVYAKKAYELKEGTLIERWIKKWMRIYPSSELVYEVPKVTVYDRPKSVFLKISL